MYPYNGRFKITKLYGTAPPAGVTYKAGYHTGVDFVGIDNKVIVSCFDGKVIANGNDVDGWGKYLKIQGEDYCAIYCHLSEKTVAVGDSVKAGEVIGKEGTTGQSTGSHLHLEFRTNHLDYRTAKDACEILGIDKKLGEVKPMYEFETGEDVIEYWHDAGIINDPDYWYKALNVVKNLDLLLLKVVQFYEEV